MLRERQQMSPVRFFSIFTFFGVLAMEENWIMSYLHLPCPIQITLKETANFLAFIYHYLEGKKKKKIWGHIDGKMKQMKIKELVL